MRTRRRLAAALLAAAALLTGCGPGGFNGLYNVPLPGGADLGEHPYTVRAEMENVLNLVPQAAVKVSNVTVGKVSGVELAPDAKTAIVTMVVNGDVALPANATAKLRQESLLGAKFVALEPPEGSKPSAQRLRDGAMIPVSRTSRTVEIEEVFGALSMLLSGGGVEQLRTISEELNKALSGNEPQIRALMTRVDTMATQLDAQKGDIVRAIDGVNRLANTLIEQKGNLTTALDNLAPGMRVLVEQRDQLVGMLTSLKDLSTVATDVVRSSGDQLVRNLEALRPILDRLADSGKNLPVSLRTLPTFPLPDVAGNVIKGDYGNADVVVDFTLDTLIENLSNSSQPLIRLPSGAGSGQPGIPFNNGTPPPALPLPESAPQGGPVPSQGAGDVPEGVGGLFGSLLGVGS